MNVLYFIIQYLSPVNICLHAYLLLVHDRPVCVMLCVSAMASKSIRSGTGHFPHFCHFHLRRSPFPLSFFLACSEPVGKPMNPFIVIKTKMNSREKQNAKINVKWATENKIEVNARRWSGKMYEKSEWNAKDFNQRCVRWQTTQSEYQTTLSKRTKSLIQNSDFACVSKCVESALAPARVSMHVSVYVVMKIMENINSHHERNIDLLFCRNKCTASEKHVTHVFGGVLPAKLHRTRTNHMHTLTENDKSIYRLIRHFIWWRQFSKLNATATA